MKGKDWWAYWKCITGRVTPYMVEAETGKYHLLVYPRAPFNNHVFVFRRNTLLPFFHFIAEFDGESIGPTHFIHTWQTHLSHDYLLYGMHHSRYGILDLYDERTVDFRYGILEGEQIWDTVLKVNGAPAPVVVGLGLERSFEPDRDVPEIDLHPHYIEPTITIGGCLTDVGGYHGRPVAVTYDFSKPLEWPWPVIDTAPRDRCGECDKDFTHPKIRHDLGCSHGPK